MNDKRVVRGGLTRRQALKWASAAAGMAATQTSFSLFAAEPQPPLFAPGAIIRTILQDVSPAAFASGPVLFHEHLSMKYPPDVKEHFTDDVELMIAEVRAAGKEGISCIVDGGHADMSRRLDALKRIATESGVGIVASGGYYMQRTYPPDVAKKSVEQIAQELTLEAKRERFGAFGEIGQQG